MTVFEKIESLQKGLEETDAYTVGEQLKDICRREPECAPLVLADLDNPDMSLKAAAGKIKAWADTKQKEKKAKCVCVPPDVAEGILRKFYGLPDAQDAGQSQPEPVTEAAPILDLASFF